MDAKFAIMASVRAAMMSAARQAFIIKVRMSTRVTCKPGCSHCCKRYVVVTLAEALVLIDFLKRNKKWDRVASVADAQKNSMSVKPVVWFKMGMTCPLLNQDMCDAYEVRPAVCSAHHAFSPPETCSPLSTSFNRYEPCELTDVHTDFMKSFNRMIGKDSVFRIRAPMPAALLAAERLSVTPGPDFDGLVATLAKEFKA